MKKQNDLLLRIPDEYNDKFFISNSRKNLKNINRIYPIQTEYETINTKGITPKRRINMNNNTFKEYNLLPIISKHGIFFDTNNLNKINKKPLEGFKPKEDNKIRNKIRIKNNNKPLSVKYLSLHEDNKQFDKYIKSILKKNKYNFNIPNNRYDSNKDDFFQNNHNLKNKLNILNKYLNKTYEKEKKDFKKYYNENEEFLNEILANEIITKTSSNFIEEENYKNTNRLYIHFSPNPKEINMNPLMNVDSTKSYDALNNIKSNRLYSNDRKYCPNLKTEKIKKKIKTNIDKDLIVHNVFFEWVVDNVILKIENKDIFKNYNSFNKNGTLMYKNNIKSILNEEIKNLSKYLFRDESNLNRSYDSLISSLRPISDYVNKIKNSSKKNKKIKSADLAKTNDHKINLGDNVFDNSDDYNNNDDDFNIEQNILNKLIDKIINNNKSDANDLKYSDNKIKNLNVFIANKKSNSKNKIFDDKDISNINKSSNINNSIYIVNKQSYNSFSSEIKEEPNEPKSEKKNSLNLRNNTNKFVLPKIINNSILRNKYIKNFLINYYSRNFNNFNDIYKKYVSNSLNADKSTRNITEQNIQNSIKKEDKLPIIPKINMERKNSEKIINTDNINDKTIEYRNEQNQTNEDYFEFNNNDKNSINLNQKLNVNYLDQNVIFEKEAQFFYKNRMNGKNILLNKNKNSYSNKIIGNNKNGYSVVLISSPEKVVKEDDKINDSKYKNKNKNKTFIKNKELIEEDGFNIINNNESIINKSLISSYNENIENNIHNIINNNNNAIKDNKNNKLNSNESEYEIKLNSNGIYINSDENKAKDKDEDKKNEIKKENIRKTISKDNKMDKDINKKIERNENKVEIRNKKNEEKEKNNIDNENNNDKKEENSVNKIKREKEKELKKLREEREEKVRLNKNKIMKEQEEKKKIYLEKEIERKNKKEEESKIKEEEKKKQENKNKKDIRNIEEQNKGLENIKKEEKKEVIKNKYEKIKKPEEKTKEKSEEKIIEKNREKNREKMEEKSKEQNREKIEQKSREKNREKTEQKSKEKNKEKIEQKSKEKNIEKNKEKDKERSKEKSMEKIREQSREINKEKREERNKEKKEERNKEITFKNEENKKDIETKKGEKKENNNKIEKIIKKEENHKEEDIIKNQVANKEEKKKENLKKDENPKRIRNKEEDKNKKGDMKKVKITKREDNKKEENEKVENNNSKEVNKKDEKTIQKEEEIKEEKIEEKKEIKKEDKKEEKEEDKKEEKKEIKIEDKREEIKEDKKEGVKEMNKSIRKKKSINLREHKEKIEIIKENKKPKKEHSKGTKNNNNIEKEPKSIKKEETIESINKDSPKKENQISKIQIMPIDDTEDKTLNVIHTNKNSKNSAQKRKSLINLLNKYTSKDYDNKNENNENEDSYDDDIDSADKEKLVEYANKIIKLNENKYKTEDEIQEEKDLKEKYKQIIMKYIMKQMHKDLVKKRGSKKYERSKIKVRYDNNKDNIENIENMIDSEDLDLDQMNDEFTSKKEDDISIILNNEDKEEKEINKELDNAMKLIYDNSYLFKRKKKDIKIRDEVLEILNKIENIDEQDKNKSSEPPSSDRNNLSSSRQDDSSKRMSRNDSMKINIKKRIKKKKPKARSEKKRMSIFEQLKSGIPNDEIKEENEGEKSDDEGIFIKRKTLEEKLEEFVKKIKMMKKSSQNGDLDVIMNELIDNNMDKEKNPITRRLYNFVETISNLRDYDKVLRPKFNFLSPVKFSTNIYSEYSNSD